MRAGMPMHTLPLTRLLAPSASYCRAEAPATLWLGRAGQAPAVCQQSGRDAMPDIVILLSRILMSAVFIVYGWMKFANVTGILNSEGTKRFMALVASGAPAPTWLGYLIAAIELLGGLAILI